MLRVKRSFAPIAFAEVFTDDNQQGSGVHHQAVFPTSPSKQYLSSI